jgi:hypothetical protein
VLALIVRNHDLLRVAAETRRQAQEATAAAERAMLSAVRLAVLRAATAGGWEATRPGCDVIRRVMLN